MFLFIVVLIQDKIQIGYSLMYTIGTLLFLLLHFARHAVNLAS